MNVRPGRVTARQTSQVDPQQQLHQTFPAPTRGWVTNENLALAQPAGAQVLENWFPTETNARVRGGSRTYATLSGYTFSRASTATYYVSGGTIATAGVNVIRKNIDPVTGVDSGFLIEAAATNLLLRSAEINDATWFKGHVSVSANAAVAPDGTTTADSVIEDNTNNNHIIAQSISGNVTASYVFSVWLKAGARSRALLAIRNSAQSIGIQTTFDLSTGQVVSSANFGTPTSTLTPAIEANLNGWHRCTIGGVLNSAGGAETVSVTAFLDNGVGSFYTGDGVSGLYVWGAQLETGSVASSYIATTSATATRAADVFAAVTPTPVLRAWTYKSGETEEFFASNLANIYNLTSVADPDIIPTPVVTGQTSGYYSTAQFGNSGGDFLSICNGTDTPQYYDGSTWADHAFTGLATPEELNFVWTFASRLWYVRKDTMEAYYLPVDNINGALTLFTLQGVFQEGGKLLFGGKWSQDSGSGLDDVCLFVSDRGEVAVYQGIDPSSATTWQKVGLYKITPPMGANCNTHVGGDLLVGTEDGIIPISQAVNKDIAALSISAVSVPIGPEWKKEVTARRTLPWEVMKWPEMNMMVVSLPVPDDNISPYCFVANVQTGAWAKYTGWNTRCLCLYSNLGFFGTNDGKVKQMEVGGNDDGEPYVCTYVGLPDHLGAPGVTKTIHEARSIFTSTVPFIAKVSASTDYRVSLPTPPSSVADFVVDEWDSGLWDVAKWDSGTASTTSTKWVSIGKSGFSIAPQIQITCGVTPYPRTELIAYDVIYENGGVMV